MKLVRCALLSATCLALGSFDLTRADDAEPAKIVAQVIDAAGGEDKLLKLFRFRERVLITATPAAVPAADEKGNRTSTIEAGGRMWVGAAPREKDKVRILIWAWSLGILKAPEAKLAVINDATVAGKPMLGVRVTGIVKEPLDMYFDPQSKLLVAIDYTDTRHLFSEWKKTESGQAYPSHVTGHRFTDRGKKTVNEKQWYQTDILELAPLSKLPAELK